MPRARAASPAPARATQTAHRPGFRRTRKDRLLLGRVPAHARQQRVARHANSVSNRRRHAHGLPAPVRREVRQQLIAGALPVGVLLRKGLLLLQQTPGALALERAQARLALTLRVYENHPVERRLHARRAGEEHARVDLKLDVAAAPDDVRHGAFL